MWATCVNASLAFSAVLWLVSLIISCLFSLLKLNCCICSQDCDYESQLVVVSCLFSFQELICSVLAKTNLDYYILIILFIFVLSCYKL
jgi:hypothetical protein